MQKGLRILLYGLLTSAVFAGIGYVLRREITAALIEDPFNSVPDLNVYPYEAYADHHRPYLRDDQLPLRFRSKEDAEAYKKEYETNR